MFNHFDNFDLFRFKLSTSRYNPYINYSWSQTLTVGNNQQIKDTGTAGLNLQQFFGQATWFNGVDQNIVLETVTPIETSSIWTICFNVNTASSSRYIVRTIGGSFKILWFSGGLTYYNGSASIKLDTTNTNRAGSYIITSDGAYIYTYLNNVLISTISQTVEELSYGLIRDLAGSAGGNYYTGVLKDVYHFKRAFSISDVDKYNNKPNQFFIDSLEDSSCILAMPMCEKDGFVRNYKSYSASAKTIDVNNTSFTSTVTNTRIAQQNIGLLVQANKTYEIVYDFLPNTNLINFTIHVPPTSNGGTSLAVIIPISSFLGKYIFRLPSTYTQTNGSTSCYMWIVVNGTAMTHLFKEISLKEISGVYPISNYTTTCRTNAQRLTYGLQTSGFKRDTNGMVLSKSDFLEVDGVGYSNTGWIPAVTKPLTFECILQKKTNLVGIGTPDSATARFSIGFSGVFGSPRIMLGNNIKLYSEVVKNVVYFAITITGVIGESRLYLDGIDKGLIGENVLNTPIGSFLIGVRGGLYEPSVAKLFKVHQKALTQEEVTKNFNTYQAQGLLNE